MSNKYNVILLFLLISLAQLSTDMLVPALPIVSDIFLVSSNVAQLTISANLIGIAISSLIYGVLADLYGRRFIILIGLVIFSASALLGFFTYSIEFLILMRLIQGIGEGAMIVGGYSGFRDTYSGTEFAKKIGYLNILLCIVPLAAPVVGSIIINYSSWRVILLGLFIGGLLSFILFAGSFKETLAPGIRREFSSKGLARSYNIVLYNPSFIGFATITFLAYCWWWVDLTNLAFLYVRDMGLPPYLYTFYVAMPMGCYIIGTMINRKLLDVYSPRLLLLVGLLLTLSSDVCLLILQTFTKLTPLKIELVSILSNGGCALVFNNSSMLALEQIPKYALARASAVTLFLDLLFSGLTIYIFGFFYNGTIIPIAIATVLSTSLSLIIFYCINRPLNKVPL